MSYDVRFCSVGTPYSTSYRYWPELDQCAPPPPYVVPIRVIVEANLIANHPEYAHRKVVEGADASIRDLYRKTQVDNHLSLWNKWIAEDFMVRLGHNNPPTSGLPYPVVDFDFYVEVTDLAFLDIEFSAGLMRENASVAFRNFVVAHYNIHLPELDDEGHRRTA